VQFLRGFGANGVKATAFPPFHINGALTVRGLFVVDGFDVLPSLVLYLQ
jgi:hypothetical protein